MGGVRFVEKPQDYQAFYFGGDFHSFKEFMRWARERGFITSYQPDLSWQHGDAVDGHPMSVPEIVYIWRSGYIKGSSTQEVLEMRPKTWFIIGLDGKPFFLNQNAVEERFKTGDFASAKEMERIQALHREA
jgi:hypothetical protein